jgi:hypothetical protein
MQRNLFTRERLARFDIVKLSIVGAAAVALVVTMAVSSSPSSAHSAIAAAKQTNHSVSKTTKSNASNSAKQDGAGNSGSDVDFGAGTVGSAPPDSIEAPSYIVNNCSVDVSKALQTWLQGLPPGTIWYSPVRSCYLINSGIRLSFPHGITIDGGVFQMKWLGYMSRQAFHVLGGSNMTFEHMTINGPNVNDIWDPQRAFQSGIELQGTGEVTISNVRITHVFGDGITLAPLRGSADHNSGVIVRPVSNLTINHVWIDGAGRQGISPVSVQNAMITDVTLHNIKMNAFDFEADQGNEGAENVTINGCTVVNASSLANIAESAGFTGPITIENCNMATLDGGTAVHVMSLTNSVENGLVTLENDSLRCQTRAPVACLQLMNGQNVTISDSNITFGPGDGEPATESVYSAINKSHARFVDDVVTGYGKRGSVDKHSSVTITGGTWTQR